MSHSVNVIQQTQLLQSCPKPPTYWIFKYVTKAYAHGLEIYPKKPSVINLFIWAHIFQIVDQVFHPSIFFLRTKKMTYTTQPKICRHHTDQSHPYALFKHPIIHLIPFAVIMSSTLLRSLCTRCRSMAVGICSFSHESISEAEPWCQTKRSSSDSLF